MEELKVLQIRDRGTNIPAIALKPNPQNFKEVSIFREAGYSVPQDYVIFTTLNGLGSNYDPHEWGVGPRTLHIAHKHLIDNWDSYGTGGVVCVEFILGERDTPKDFEGVAYW